MNIVYIARSINWAWLMTFSRALRRLLAFDWSVGSTLMKSLSHALTAE